MLFDKHFSQRLMQLARQIYFLKSRLENVFGGTQASRFDLTWSVSVRAGTKDLLRISLSCRRARSSRVLTVGMLSCNAAAVSVMERPCISRKRNTVLYSRGSCSSAWRSIFRSWDWL